MNDSFDELYFDWLRGKLLAPRDFNYEALMLLLYKTEFVWNVLMDENRAADGIELRYDFLREGNYPRDNDWLSEPCSVLEMLIGFSQRAAFVTDWPVRDWFWKMIDNLGLSDYRRISQRDLPEIQKRLNTFMHRTYNRNGGGGLFPIHDSKNDQRKVEIWYQFNEYVQAESLI